MRSSKIELRELQEGLNLQICMRAASLKRSQIMLWFSSIIISWTSLPARLKLLNSSILNIPYLIYFIEHCSWKIYNCGAIESQVMIIFIAQVYTFIRLETICKDRGGSLAGNFFYLHFTKYNNWLKPFWIKIWTFNQLQFQKSFFLKFKYHDVSLFSILWFLFKSGL